MLKNTSGDHIWGQEMYSSMWESSCLLIQLCISKSLLCLASSSVSVAVFHVNLIGTNLSWYHSTSQVSLLRRQYLIWKFFLESLQKCFSMLTGYTTHTQVLLLQKVAGNAYHWCIIFRNYEFNTFNFLCSVNDFNMRHRPLPLFLFVSTRFTWMAHFEIKTVNIAEKRRVCIPVSRPTGIPYATLALK